MIVRHGDVEQLELPAATFGLLADSGTTLGTLGANRLSLGTGADGATVSRAGQIRKVNRVKISSRWRPANRIG